LELPNAISSKETEQHAVIFISAAWNHFVVGRILFCKSANADDAAQFKR